MGLKKSPYINYENYEVSNLGNVKNITTNNLLRLSKRGNYYSIGLTDKNKIRKSFRVHRLCMYDIYS